MFITTTLVLVNIVNMVKASNIVTCINYIKTIEKGKPHLSLQYIAIMQMKSCMLSAPVISIGNQSGKTENVAFTTFQKLSLTQRSGRMC